MTSASAAKESPRSQWLQRHLARFHALLFVGMLAALYPIFLEQGIGNWQRTLFVLHLGLFLIWQPVIERHREVSQGEALITLGAVAVATTFLNGWLLLLWVVLLSGIVGGKVLLAGSARLRLSYLAALAYLVTVLLVLVVPTVVPDAQVSPTLRWAVLVGLPMLLAVILVLPPAQLESAEAEVLDLVNSTILVLLLAVLVLGSLSSMLLFKFNYVSALLQTLFGMGGLLLLLGWLWNPRYGQAGLQNVFSRYLLSIGVPAQQWLEALAELTLHEDNPERFFAKGCADLAKRVTWIRGLEWKLTQGSDASGVLGLAAGECAVFVHPGVEVKIYSRYVLPPSVMWHINLLIQFLSEFHADKQRAARLRELSYLQAVHETGARLTHDVKNLLQSMQTLIYAADHADATDAQAFRTLMRRQLPTITARLAITLEKLRAPQAEHQRVLIPVGDWWDTMRQRYANEAWLSFSAQDVSWVFPIPENVFTTVLDNLVANAIDKRACEPGLSMHIALEVSGVGVALSACDDGSPVPAAQRADLLSRPVESRNGLGIGLYQSNQLAQAAGYELVFSSNAASRVCFSLRPRPEDQG